MTNPARGAKSVFRPSTPEDQPAIAQFLSRIFRLPLTHPTIQPAHLYWKYWKPGLPWNGSRSYLLERDGAILAHAAVWPLELLTGSDRLRCFGFLDWAADPASTGAGIALTSKMFQLADVVCVVGGSDDAMRMRAAMGFRPRNRLDVMGRPLRPLQQIAGDRPWKWKTPARLLRNLGWSMQPLAAPDPAWTAVPAKPEDGAEFIEQPEAVGFGGTVRLVEYVAECPVIRSAFRLVLREGRPAGCYFLTFAMGQARIAGAWLASAESSGWLQLYRLALAEVRRDRQSNEIAAFAATPSQRQALDACGFHARRFEDVLVYDRGKQVPADAHINFQMVHGDIAFLSEDKPSYLT